MKVSDLHCNQWIIWRRRKMVLKFKFCQGPNHLLPLGNCSIELPKLICSILNDFKKGDPAEIFWKYFQNKWFSWSYKTTNLTEKWRNCWVFWRKSRYFDWFKYGFSITPTEFITYFQNISAGLPFLKSLDAIHSLLNKSNTL